MKFRIKYCVGDSQRVRECYATADDRLAAADWFHKFFGDSAGIISCRQVSV